MLGEHDRRTVESLSALGIVHQEVRMYCVAPASQYTMGSQGVGFGLLDQVCSPLCSVVRIFVVGAVLSSGHD